MTVEAAFLAKSIEKNIQARPDLWEYEILRLKQLISQPSIRGEEHEREIRTAAGKLVTKTDFTETRPIIAVSAPFFDAGRLAGSIAVRHSIRTNIITTALLGMLSSLLSCLSYFLFRTYPIRKLESTLVDLHGAQEAVRQLEENFHRFLDDFPLGARIVTAEGGTIYANRAILDIYGYDSVEELRTTPVKNRYTPQSYAEFKIRREKRKGGDDWGSEYEVSIVRKNGEVRHLQVFRKDVLWNGERQFQAVYQDITEHKKAEDALRESEVRYRNLFENANEAIFVAQDGNLVFLNPMTAVLIGYSGEKLVSRPFVEFIHPDDQDMVLDRHVRRMKGEEFPHLYSF
ncbi:MAG: PAS domain-containing protein, partial [Pseudomonadota bacterium]